MTDAKQPDALELASVAESADLAGYPTAKKANAYYLCLLEDCAQMIRRLHAENETLRAELETLREKLKTYEDLGDAADDMQLLRMGYAAARLEIESLQARFKTMAEEHADELMVAHLDGRMRAAQPVTAQQPAPSAAPAVSDEDEALDLLATLFDAWESGTPCYEEPESSDGFLGHAFRLDDEVFHRCADLLNRRRGKQPAPAPKADSQPATQQEAQEPVAWRELCRRLYVELFYCDQQLTSGKRPKWQQGKTVRDVLADAKAALDAAHQPSPAAQGDADLTQCAASLGVQPVVESAHAVGVLMG